VQTDRTDALVTKRADGTVAIALWNYAPPGAGGAARTFQISLKGSARFRVEIVDPDHGSALGTWRAMGSPAFPTREQYEQLRRAAVSTLKLATPTFSLPAHGLALVEVD